MSDDALWALLSPRAAAVCGTVAIAFTVWVAWRIGRGARDFIYDAAGAE